MWNHHSCYPDNFYRCFKLSSYWWIINSPLAKVNGLNRRCWSGSFAWLLHMQHTARSVQEIFVVCSQAVRDGEYQKSGEARASLLFYLLIFFSFCSQPELPFLLDNFYLQLTLSFLWVGTTLSSTTWEHKERSLTNGYSCSKSLFFLPFSILGLLSFCFSSFPTFAQVTQPPKCFRLCLAGRISSWDHTSN